MKMAAANCLMMLGLGIANGQTPTPTPDQIREEVVVTANRIETRIGDTPASVVTISRREIESAAAPTIDDILRQSAGFSIFRRSSSRNANPTTQGVSLRGVGASGASRSAVLFDDVPLGDPFGGWIQWNRVPAIAVETVEVLRGGASSLYGNAGLSGAINVIPRKGVDYLDFSADVFGGTQKTLSGSAFVGMDFHPWLVDGYASSFQTRGFRIVDSAVRGPVDSFSGVRTSTISAKVSRQFTDRASLFFRPSYFGEVRGNGTPLQANRTHIRQLIIGADAGFGPNSRTKFAWRAFGGTQVFDQTFTAINLTRSAESLTRVQRVPVQNVGFSMQISSAFRDHTFVGGLDARKVRGASDEIAFAANRPTAILGAGGRETAFGFFAQDFVKIGRRLVVAGSVRYDRWRNYDAFSRNRPLVTGVAANTLFADRLEDAISLQGAILIRLSEEISIYANASRSFRAPTLNELYRAFRVGNILTLANENLRAERSRNVEGGVSYVRRNLSVRASVFEIAIDAAVGNITLATTPDLITRQRRNAGKTNSRGFEVEGELRVKNLHLGAGYLFVDSRVAEFPANQQLVNLRLPQVPRHQVTFQSRFTVKKWTTAIQARASGSQFDDDLNLFRLERYFQLDVFVARRISEGTEIYASIENIFNSRYSVGRTPIRTVSSPANFRIGLRWR